MDIRQSLTSGSAYATQALAKGENVIKPLSARWGVESQRRKNLRTPEALAALRSAQCAYGDAVTAAHKAKRNRLAARKGGTWALSAERRVAAISDRLARAQAASAKTELRAAVAACPETLEFRAMQAHALHVVPSVVVSGMLSGPLWPALASAGLVGLNVAVAALSARVRPAEKLPLPDGLSREEADLMRRLDPSWWVEHAPARGLEGTVPGRADLGPGGISVPVRTDGKWNPSSLAAAEAAVRNLLGMKTATRMRVVAGTRGGWAVIQISTRSAAEGTGSLWTPDRMPTDPKRAGMMSLGLDTETGDEVLLQFDERLLLAGASGTGKSWSSRPLMAHAHLRGALLFIDGKGEEANIWDGVCRCATEPAEIKEAVREAYAEMHRRRLDMKRRRISVWDGEQLTVAVDEGQVVLACMAKDAELIQMLIELSSLGRSRGIVLWWATQKPVMSGSAPGVHNMIAPNLLQRFSLRVADETEARNALDDCAHYGPHRIPDDRAYRGHGYLRGYGPRMIRTWTLDDDGVRALPAKLWGATSTATAATVILDKQDVAVAASVATAVAPASPAVASQRERIFEAVRSGARYAKEVVECTGCNKGNVSRELKRLVSEGRIHRSEDGRLTPVTNP